MEIDRVFAAGPQRLREIDEDGVDLAVELERRSAKENLLDLQVRVQVDLNAAVVLQHPKPDGVLAAQELLRGVDADVQVIGEKVIVGAVAAVLAAQDVGA